MNRIISPSLLSADFSILKEQIDIVKKAGAKRLHIDCMDGHFVPNFTFGPFIVKAIRKLTDLHLLRNLIPGGDMAQLRQTLIMKRFHLIFLKKH